MLLCLVLWALLLISSSHAPGGRMLLVRLEQVLHLHLQDKRNINR